MRKSKILIATALFSIVFVLRFLPASAFTSSLLMDSTVFDASGSMNASQVDGFLNGFGSSCISPASGFAAIVPSGYSPSGGFTYGGFGTAGQVITAAAQAYDLNPQVLIVTLEKEQSLITGRNNFAGYCNNGDEHKYASAVGYGCPDSGTTHSYTGVSLYRRNGVEHTNTGTTCVDSASKAGFSQQVIRAAWLLKFGEQRSTGNIGWAVVKGSWDNSDDPATCYGGPMTQGTFKRCPSSAAVSYDGYTTIDAVATHMDTGPTAAFYWYTPHFHGNQIFVSLFETWFGGTVSASYYSCHNSSNVSGAPTGEHIIGSKLGINHTDNLRLVVPNNTGTNCAEVHTWQNNNYNSWIQHIATNSPAINPNTQSVLSADGNGDGIDELFKVDYSGTSSGMIEVHTWSNTIQGWIGHTATNRPSLNLSDSEVITADLDGDGRDSTFLVQYRNTGSGRIEVHGWSPNLQQWVSHIATNYGAVDPATAQVKSADLNGDGRDELYLVNYSGSSGRIEVHGWSPNLQQWVSHIATVSPSTTHVDGAGNPISDIIVADTNGDGRDELYKIDYSGTGSGRVEVHGLSTNLQQWVSHIATNQGAY
jgi:hypothetical protein